MLFLDDVDDVNDKESDGDDESADTDERREANSSIALIPKDHRADEPDERHHLSTTKSHISDSALPVWRRPRWLSLSGRRGSDQYCHLVNQITKFTPCCVVCYEDTSDLSATSRACRTRGI